MWLLLPALTDIRATYTNGSFDVVDCPAGSGRIYAVVFVDDSGKGFANEHRVACLSQYNAAGLWPTPIP
jgi:hypothetical protein